MKPRDHCAWRLLLRLESGRLMSQRALARELGIALGSTNCLLHRIERAGWIEVVRTRRNRVQYRITPEGVRQEAEMARAYFSGAVQLYSEARDRIRRAFDALSATWPPSPDGRGAPKRIVFYGAGEVAEIGYVSLQDSGLRLVGVVAEATDRPFFGLPVHAPDRLRATELDGEPFDRLVVMSFEGPDDDIRARLETLGVPLQRVAWLS